MTTLADRLAVDGGTPVRAEPLDHRRGILELGDDEIAAVVAVLRSRALFRYHRPDHSGTVAAFEVAIAEFLGVPHAVATSSGTAALRAGLAALGVGPGDEVIVAPATFIATVNAVVIAGAVPVFADIDDSLGIDASAVAAAITPRTVAILPVHLENVAVDLDPLLAVAAAHDLPVLEDAAQALGATYHGRALGTIGTMGAYSLQADKNITSGEGGVLVTADERLHYRAARYGDQGGQFVTARRGGRGDGRDEVLVGENLRMTEVAGAIAGVQLTRLADLLQRWRRVAAAVRAGVGELDGLTPRHVHDPEGNPGSSLTWYAPSAEVARRFVAALNAEGVPSVQLYDGQPVYATRAIAERRTAAGHHTPWDLHGGDVTYGPGLCPRAEDLLARSVTVAIGATWDERDVDDAVAAIGKVATALLRA